MGNKNSAYQAKFKAKEWQWQLKSEAKQLEKEIQKIQKQEQKLRREIEAQAEKGNIDTVQQLAKSIVRSEKAVKRLEHTKASMHAVDLQLTTSLATMSTTSSLKVSADIMAKMNQICGVSEVGATMEAMRAEMARVAEAEEFVEEALQNAEDDYSAAEEVQRVLEGMALEKMGPLRRLEAPTQAAPPAQEAAPPAAVPAAPQKQLVAAGMEHAATPAAPRPPAAQQQPTQQQPMQPMQQQAPEQLPSSGTGALPAEAQQPSAPSPEATHPPAAPEAPSTAPAAEEPPKEQATALSPVARLDPLKGPDPVFTDAPQGDDDLRTRLWARLNELKK